MKLDLVCPECAHCLKTGEAEEFFNEMGIETQCASCNYVFKVLKPTLQKSISPEQREEAVKRRKEFNESTNGGSGLNSSPKKKGGLSLSQRAELVEKKGKRANLIKSLLVFLVAAIAGTVIYGIYADNRDVSLCQESIKKNLKSPSSAVFTDVEKIGNNITMTVDSANSFRTMLRSKWGCTVVSGKAVITKMSR